MKISKLKESLLPYDLLITLLRYEHETGLFYWVKRGRGRKVNQPIGYTRSDGYVVIIINGHNYYAHRLAWAMWYGDFPEGGGQFLIDHVNGKRDDNRIANLKVASYEGNNRNAQKNSRNKSGTTGAFRWDKKFPSGKTYAYWRATWHDENGKKQCKDFPIHTHGEESAEQMAIDCRAEQIRILELNHGIVYSPRHGT